MSVYTTELRYICEVESGLTDSEGYNSINSILDACRQHIFSFEYPIFDEQYRPVLEKKILKHYYTREICAETVGLWKLYLDARMNEIMPYYNKLYQSELLQFNPLYDVDLTTDHTKTGGTERDATVTSSEITDMTRTDNLTRTDDITVSSDHTRTDDLTTESDFTRTDDLTRESDFTRTDDLEEVSQDSGTQKDERKPETKNLHWESFSDTPQGALSNIDNNTYLTSARKITDDTTGSKDDNLTTFGKKVTITNDGTQRNAGSETNTGTQRNAGSETHTGTQRNAGDDTTSGTVTNTGTQRNAGSVTGSNITDDNISTTESYLQHVQGKSGGTSYAKMLMEYRETFINIDLMVIDDLQDLFMGLY